jgi:Rrf2 family protein
MTFSCRCKQRNLALVITRATEYAIRTIIFLARQPRETIVLKKDICRTQNVTPAFLTKILQPLIKKGIVSSQRGVGGGFLLACDPQSITILDLLEAQEGPLTLNHCLSEDSHCKRDAYCAAHQVWAEAQAEMIKVLKSRSIAQLAAAGEEK